MGKEKLNKAKTKTVKLFFSMEFYHSTAKSIRNLCIPVTHEGYLLLRAIAPHT